MSTLSGKIAERRGVLGLACTPCEQVKGASQGVPRPNRCSSSGGLRRFESGPHDVAFGAVAEDGERGSSGLPLFSKNQKSVVQNGLLEMKNNLEGMMRLKDKIALVTGDSRGIGEAIAKRFAEEGATVVSGDIRKPTYDPLNGIEHIDLDVTTKVGWKKAVSHAVAKHGRLDILVNNAGWYSPR